MKEYNQSELIQKERWDVLIILDACRFDEFTLNLYKTPVKGKLYMANSHSPNTEEWYYRNWMNEYREDIILISANPHSKITGAHENFYISVEVWNNDNWIYPETALDVLIDLQQEYPNKKFIVHLIPPHLPYISEEGKQFLDELGVYGNGLNVYRTVQKYGRENGWKKPLIYYIENIIEALERIAKYIPKIKGNIIITSDHGEKIGEDFCYGHNSMHPVMFIVPWLEVLR